MKKGYWVVSYRTITDPQAAKNYSALAANAIEAAGGRIFSRGIAVEAHEAGRVERTVLVEFDDVEKAKAAYESDAYKKALAVLTGAAERDFRIVEGV
jgi:uncharacterized protein (DUF1330 family)